VSVIPRYWYCESADGSGSFQLTPAQMVSICPEPSTGQARIIFDPLTGEVYGEAILMSALPRSRFCCFTFGKEIVLPHRVAVALESHEAEYGFSVLKGFVKHHLTERLYRSLHYRVEIIQLERFALTPVIDRHWYHPFCINLSGVS
jgi:hypothetical protein